MRRFGRTLAKVLTTFAALCTIPAGWPLAQCVGPDGRVRLDGLGFSSGCSSGTPTRGTGRRPLVSGPVCAWTATTPAIIASAEEDGDDQAPCQNGASPVGAVVSIPAVGARQSNRIGWKCFLPPPDLVVAHCHFTC